MARCLVTGHRGYIGSHLFKTLKDLGHEVQGIDLVEGHDIIKDLKEYNEPMRGHFHPHYWNFKPEYIFHLACIPRVAYSVDFPTQTMENNVLCTTHVLNFARKVGAKRVIYSGSSSVVGDGNSPNSPYALQKLFSEMECRLYSKLYNLDTVTLRYFNVYSPDQKANGPYATAVSNFMQFIRDGKNPFITGSGEQRRDMANVNDVVSANIFAMEYEGNFDGQHYDVGTGQNISLNEIANIVLDYFPDISFDYVDPREGDVLFTKADMSNMQEVGWVPLIDIFNGISECFGRLKDELR